MLQEPAPTESPGNHTPDGGVLLGNREAGHRLVLFEDPQCPYCRAFEEAAGDLLRREVAAGALTVEYRIRCFLGEESVRASAALALAAEEGHFDGLLQALFAQQPPEGSGGFTDDDLIALGAGVGLTGERYREGVRAGRYRDWAVATDESFQPEDEEGTPKAVLDGEVVDPGMLADANRLSAVLRAGPRR
jgi:hypothetical protein